MSSVYTAYLENAYSARPLEEAEVEVYDCAGAKVLFMATQRKAIDRGPILLIEFLKFLNWLGIPAGGAYYIHGPFRNQDIAKAFVGAMRKLPDSSRRDRWQIYPAAVDEGSFRRIRPEGDLLRKALRKLLPKWIWHSHTQGGREVEIEENDYVVIEKSRLKLLETAYKRGHVPRMQETIQLEQLVRKCKEEVMVELGGIRSRLTELESHARHGDSEDGTTSAAHNGG